ncbi:MAG: hypothetical protein KDK24_03680 [Pseudooceanicola sp.]|nr:hypothetical protein [Pseudooceanicola sp.]
MLELKRLSDPYRPGITVNVISLQIDTGGIVIADAPDRAETPTVRPGTVYGTCCGVFDGSTRRDARGIRQLWPARAAAGARQLPRGTAFLYCPASRQARREAVFTSDSIANFVVPSHREPGMSRNFS